MKYYNVRDLVKIDDNKVKKLYLVIHGEIEEYGPPFGVAICCNCPFVFCTKKDEAEKSLATGDYGFQPSSMGAANKIKKIVIPEDYGPTGDAGPSYRDIYKVSKKVNEIIETLNSGK